MKGSGPTVAKVEKHYTTSLGAPTYREPPNADDIAVHVNYDVVSGRLELPKRWDHYPSYINAPCY